MPADPKSSTVSTWAACCLVACGAVLLPLAQGTGQATRSAPNVGRSQPSAVRPLFNGRNLEGFYTYLKESGKNHDPRQVFTVRDGAIRISGEEWGSLTTEEEFENYHLLVEYRWGERSWFPREHQARDSGILLHSVGKDGGYARLWMPSIECQLIEGGSGDVLAVNDSSDRIAVTCPVAAEKQGESHVFDPKGKPVTITSGRINWYGRDPGWKDVKGFRGPRDVEKPIGAWNRIECIAEGAALTFVLNGTLVNHCSHVRPQKGRIQIQSEGAEIFIRRMDLMPLPEKPRGTAAPATRPGSGG